MHIIAHHFSSNGTRAAALTGAEIATPRAPLDFQWKFRESERRCRRSGREKFYLFFEFIQTLFFLLAVTSRTDEDLLMNEYDFCGSSLIEWRIYRRIGVRDRKRERFSFGIETSRTFREPKL